MKIGCREIGRTCRPYLIAEMSGNHNQSLERAMQIVYAAAKNGADAIKLQTYTADSMTLNLPLPGFTVDDPKSLWAGQHLHALYNEAHTPWAWHEAIFAYAESLGIDCFSTPFDDSAVEFLEHLNAPAYKIASFEITDTSLIRRVARTGKPLILSTGMASVGEIDAAVQTAREAGCRDLILLKCTSAYPAPADKINIATIPHMRTLFGCEVGLSDHTLGCGVAIAAVALGASVIEKHFTLNRSDGGLDASFSMEPAEFGQLRAETDRAWQAVGQVSYGPSEDEVKSLLFRRSIYVAKDMQAGEKLTRENLRRIRPGLGMNPAHYEALLGLRVGTDIKAGTPMAWSLLSEQSPG